ncbi:DUF397 domain-containing protein [Sphaerisporangium sp. NPDC088356]|uniref:DUF397 domain-containing protein n=1 Tax=Sphaerisporangium sp. NPDC088356 TaxID=3154871 RepID=UPI00343B2AC2
MDISQVKWRKSTRSSGQGGNCVEVGLITDPHVTPSQTGSGKLLLVRDSKDPDGPVLAFPSYEWNAFVRGVKASEFD